MTLFVCLPLAAQDTRYGIPQTDYFSRREYNAASQNWSITQSLQDILYFANNDGILEYDGNNWNIYQDMEPYIIRNVKGPESKIYVTDGMTQKTLNLYLNLDTLFLLITRPDIRYPATNTQHHPQPLLLPSLLYYR